MKKIFFLIIVVFSQSVFAEEKLLSVNEHIFLNSFEKSNLNFAKYVVVSELERKFFPSNDRNYNQSFFLKKNEEKIIQFEYIQYRTGETAWMRQISNDRGLTFYSAQDKKGYGTRFLIQQMKIKGRDGETDRIYGIAFRIHF